MIEKGPVSVSMGRRRGERMWMPEKAAGCNGESVMDWGSGEWLVASGEWDELLLVSWLAGWDTCVPGFFAPLRMTES
jgi:hypothetical protein